MRIGDATVDSSRATSTLANSSSGHFELEILKMLVERHPRGPQQPGRGLRDSSPPWTTTSSASAARSEGTKHPRHIVTVHSIGTDSCRDGGAEDHGDHVFWKKAKSCRFV